MHTGCIDFSQEKFGGYSRDDFTVVPQNSKAALLPFQTVFIVAALCRPCPFADRLFGHNFPQREFIVCKMKFYSRAQNVKISEDIGQ